MQFCICSSSIIYVLPFNRLVRVHIGMSTLNVFQPQNQRRMLHTVFKLNVPLCLNRFWT